MVRIETLGSGSTGNGYIITCNDEKLLLELGVNWNDIIKKLNFKEGFRKVCGCIVSHKHLDHLNSTTIKKALSRGVRVYSCQEVHELYPQINVIKPNTKRIIGGFQVMAIKLFHNAENNGYLITCPDSTRILFCTDTCQIPYKFKNINAFMVEANYDQDIIIDKVLDDTYSISASENHMEIHDTIDFLKANFSSSVQAIMLIHLSNQNSDEKKFVSMVQDELGFDNVLAADKDVDIEIKEDF